MRIIKAPLRVSLFGGGADIPEYYEKHGCTIISFALDRSIYLIHNPRPTGGYRVTYSEVEELGSLTTAKHTLIKAAAERYDLGGPCTLSIVSDVPKGTGLGSSSALSVALMRLLGPTLPATLTRMAYSLERSVHGGVGIQDFLPASYGSFNVYRIGVMGDIHCEPCSQSMWRVIEEYGLLLYTGITRDSAPILDGLKLEGAQSYLESIQGIARDVAEEMPQDPDRLSWFLNASWRHKREIAGVTNTDLDAQFEAALRAGAWGGKLCGAGAGGCWFFLVPPHRREAVEAMLGLPEIPFRIGDEVSEMKF